MPMLADLDHPPRSRTRDFLIGALFGLPVVALLAWLLLPRLVGGLLGSAVDYDQRLRAEDGYMQAVCTQAFDLARDEQLCECALAVEFPALDCRLPFLRWSLDRHHERCADSAVKSQALTFCSCIDTLAEKIPPLEAEDPDSARPLVQRVGKCLELEDGFPLPEIEALAPSGR
ncbi:MAG: hypothetical protein JNL82_01315 [Myxococcales bacterium]|jgi:hypothetical protein|nr:hypothetical protein [Myxococcales bacterium]